MKPIRPVDISVEEKQKIVQMLQERIRGYKENLSLLYDDLDALKPLSKNKFCSP